MSNTSLSKETEGKLRQFYRLLISSRDFKQARLIAFYILENNLHDQQDYKSRILLEALNCAMIIAYCRPFSGSDRKTRPKIPDLSGRFLKVFDGHEKEMHNIVMEDRNRVLAHSDSSAWALKPEVWNIKGHKVVVPWQNDTRAPLTRQATETLSQMCQKLIQEIFNTRISLEEELMEFFDTITFSDEELETIRKEIPDNKN